jgi:hypothetical protein
VLLTRDKGATQSCRTQRGHNSANEPRDPAVRAVGSGRRRRWELLYRGYLLWLLPPLMGMPAAVILAAVAYGLGHGASDWRSVAGATVSSFLFTIAYALSGSCGG